MIYLSYSILVICKNEKKNKKKKTEIKQRFEENKSFLQPTLMIWYFVNSFWLIRYFFYCNLLRMHITSYVTLNCFSALVVSGTDAWK